MSKAKKKPDIEFALKRIFKKQAFRSVQREVIEVPLNGAIVILFDSTNKWELVYAGRPRCVSASSNGSWKVIVLSTAGSGG